MDGLWLALKSLSEEPLALGGAALLAKCEGCEYFFETT